MLLEFEIQATTEDEFKLIDSFCDMIVHSIKNDIYKNIIPTKFDKMSQRLLKANWIQWKIKPNTIDSDSLLLFILRNLTYVIRNGNKVKIYFKNITLPNTYNRLDQFIRYLDMGTEIAPITLFITSIFNKYRYNINAYWKAYIQSELGVYPKGNVTIN